MEFTLPSELEIAEGYQRACRRWKMARESSFINSCRCARYCASSARVSCVTPSSVDGNAEAKFGAAARHTRNPRACPPKRSARRRDGRLVRREPPNRSENKGAFVHRPCGGGQPRSPFGPAGGIIRGTWLLIHAVRQATCTGCKCASQPLRPICSGPDHHAQTQFLRRKPGRVENPSDSRPSAIRSPSTLSFVPKVKIDVFVTWGLADKAVEAIQPRERCQIGDGKIFVSTIERTLRIRTGEADDAAHWGYLHIVPVLGVGPWPQIARTPRG
jgi:Nitrogen regulatory protein P-II